MIAMIGKKFGLLTVISHYPVSDRRGMYLCKCDCGTNKVVYGGHLRAGSTKSCGCGPKKGAPRTHNMSGSSEYKAWDNARDRCRNQNNRKYPLYGGRGISMCDRWIDSFANFIADMGRKPSRGHTLERKNCDGAYSPENCTWATYETQNNNRRFNRRLEIAGKSYTVAQASRLTGIAHATILGRLDAGKSDSEAIRHV